MISYSNLLSKTFNAHINIEFCNSLKSIKYIYKYVIYGCIHIPNIDVNTPRLNGNDEIMRYKIGRYISYLVYL